MNTIDNSLNKATDLSKLEYALIHSSWMPSKEDVQAIITREHQLNPYNDNWKPKKHSNAEIVNNLRIKYFKQILNNLEIF